MEVGKRIRAVRQQRGMSLRDLAHRSGVSKAYLSQLENDPGRRPSVDVVCRIAEALGVSVLELLGRGEPGATTPEAASRPGGTPAPGEIAAAIEPGTARVGSGAGVAASDSRGPAASHYGPARGSPGMTARPAPAWNPGGQAGSGPAQAREDPAAGGPAGDGAPLDPEQLPPALRLFWEEHPYVTEAEIRSLANISWCGRRPFTPTDYWVLHQVLSGMLRDA